MFELFGFFLLAAVVLSVIAGFALMVALIKLAMVPVALAAGAVKVTLAFVGILVGLVVMAVIGPILLVVGMALLPFAILAGVAWAAVTALI